jgi:hypothetical protein
MTQEERTTAKFLRGLTIGALIGAVIAGSKFWRWFDRRRSKEESRPR